MAQEGRNGYPLTAFFIVRKGCEMKKAIILLVILMLIGMAGIGMAADQCRATAEKTASAAIITGAGSLCGVMIATDGTNAVTLNIYDNTAASGTKLIPTRVIPTSATSRGWSLSFIPAIPFKTGLYISVATDGSVSYVPYVSPQ